MIYTGTDTERRRVIVTPEREDLIDAGFVVLLMALALIGFRSTYSGSGYLIVGLIGTLLGLVIAHLANVLRQPMVAVVAAALVVFFLAGGAVVLHSSAIGGVVPSGSTFRQLGDESVHGWRRLLTTLPPVDGSGSLLVLPYLLGILGGVAGFAIARRTRPSLAPVSAPFLVLAAVILLGTQSPAARVLQGAVFGVVALGWVAVRSARLRPPIQNGGGRNTRFATVGVLLAVALAGGALLGPHAPGNDAHSRTVLRSYVEPPFDIGQYPSPLAGFRKYTQPAKDLYDRKLFTVDGLAAGSLVRIATLDDYNGLTWTASNRAAVPGRPASTFQRVGTEITDPARGRSVAYRVTIDDGYDDVWVPDVGATTRLNFGGSRAGDHASAFRFNLATGTGVVPGKLTGGDSYSVSAVQPPTSTLRKSDSVSAAGTAPQAGSFLHTQAGDWSRQASGASAQVLALAGHLRTVGKFTDGEPPNQQYLPGHGQGRLLTFVNGSQIAGDEEQFAATLALTATQLGIPARVVLGAQLPESGVVKGKNVTAWVEVGLDDGTWRAVLPSTFLDKTKKPNQTPPQQQQQQAGMVVPPPARGRPHSGLLDASDANSQARSPSRDKKPDASDGSGLPAWIGTTVRYGGPPVLAILLILALIVGAKTLRRQRRRTRGSPATRLAHGWLELVDRARDLGSPMPAGRTRREQARELATHDLVGLAHGADARVFGALDPDDATATAYWLEVDSTLKRMTGGLGWRRRLLAAVNLRSFRRPPALGARTT